MSARPSGPFRHQLASYSPIDGRGLALALGALATSPSSRASALATTASLLRRRQAVSGVALVGSGTEALVATLRIAERLSGLADAPIALPALPWRSEPA